MAKTGKTKNKKLSAVESKFHTVATQHKKQHTFIFSIFLLFAITPAASAPLMWTPGLRMKCTNRLIETEREREPRRKTDRQTKTMTERRWVVREADRQKQRQ